MTLTDKERDMIIDALAMRAVKLREEASAEATRVKVWDNEWTTALCERAREFDALVKKLSQNPRSPNFEEAFGFITEGK
jgi:hypothetical protein